MRFLAIVLLIFSACSGSDSDSTQNSDSGFPADLPGQGGCSFVESGFGPRGEVPLKVEKLVTGLEVPWAIGFLPEGDYLVSERPGRVRRVSGNSLVAAPVLTLDVGEEAEGGLLGLAVDPRFSENRAFYVYYTAEVSGQNVNRVERYRLSEDLSSAQLERTLLENVPAGTFHNGGRIKFGPDGALYVGTGDSRNPELSQDASSRAGKILRIQPDSGAVENFVTGVRNTQGFDWWNDQTLIVSDHGPSGELGLTGRDELSVAKKGDNLGWPRVTACGTGEGFVTPFLSWANALPPGGAIVYRGNLLPSFKNSILVTALGSEHLHRVSPDGSHQMYLVDEAGFGRLREVIQAPDGSVYITTSNCDGRGSCGSEKDLILRVTEGNT